MDRNETNDPLKPELTAWPSVAPFSHLPISKRDVGSSLGRIFRALKYYYFYNFIAVRTK